MSTEKKPVKWLKATEIKGFDLGISEKSGICKVSRSYFYLDQLESLMAVLPEIVQYYKDSGALPQDLAKEKAKQGRQTAKEESQAAKIALQREAALIIQLSNQGFSREEVIRMLMAKDAKAS